MAQNHLLILFPGMSHGCLPLLPRLWAFWLFTRRTTHGSPRKVLLGTLVHALLAATKVSVSQAEGGRYAKHAQETDLHQRTTRLVSLARLSRGERVWCNSYTLLVFHTPTFQWGDKWLLTKTARCCVNVIPYLESSLEWVIAHAQTIADPSHIDCRLVSLIRTTLTLPTARSNDQMSRPAPSCCLCLCSTSTDNRKRKRLGNEACTEARQLGACNIVGS